MKNRSFPFIAGFLGLVMFIVFGGKPSLDVTNISFMLDGDPAQHWIGWEFFRHTPLLQWPIGNNTAYGIGLNNSIVYTDSIPLFALFFKLISPLLPETFQYTGIWIATCFVLQGATGFLLLNKLTENKWYSLLGSLLFVF